MEKVMVRVTYNGETLMVRVMGDGEIHITSRGDVENDDSRDHNPKRR